MFSWMPITAPQSITAMITKRELLENLKKTIGSVSISVDINETNPILSYVLPMMMATTSFVQKLYRNENLTKGRQRQDSERVYEETLNRVLSGEMNDLFYSTEIR